MQRLIQQRTRLVISGLMILLFMQFSAISHANEHLLNYSEIHCITHLEAEQFNHLLVVTAIEIIDNQKNFISYSLCNSVLATQFTPYYQSRAPPLLIH